LQALLFRLGHGRQPEAVEPVRWWWSLLPLLPLPLLPLPLLLLLLALWLLLLAP
jgi:hypothetical protein